MTWADLPEGGRLLLTILATILVLGVLILVHELGHFWAAKAVDIEVPRFSIGLGPKLLGIRRGETEYVISWFPLGGYVKMAGMADEEAMGRLEGGVETEREPSPRDFEAKPLWARVVVICAGVAMNLLFAFAAFTLLAAVEGVTEPVVSEVREGTPAETAGLQVGDRLHSIGGKRVRDTFQVPLLIQERAGEEIPVVVERGEIRLTLKATPAPVTRYREAENDSVQVGILGIGVGRHRSVGLLEAVGAGARKTANWSYMVVDFLGQLVTGRSSARDLGGPIMIGQISGAAARAGLWSLLGFMAIISVNLAILNLLPIPILDGGHLIFLLVEGVRGRALSVEQRLRLSQVGLVVVAGIMVWAIGNDILRLLGI
ncbi:MAG: RIP metalloprotease RseP [Gemmatimonadota bacterium]